MTHYGARSARQFSSPFNIHKKADELGAWFWRRSVTCKQVPSAFVQTVSAHLKSREVARADFARISWPMCLLKDLL